MYQDYETAEGSREPSIDPKLMTGQYIVGSDGVPYGPFPVAQRDTGLPSPDHHAKAARTAQVSLNTRLELGRILVQHRNRDDDTAGAIDAILALFDAEAGAR